MPLHGLFLITHGGRWAGVHAATKDMHSPDDVALKVLPAVSAALIDPDRYASQPIPSATCYAHTQEGSSVRSQAFKTMAAFIKQLEAVSYEVRLPHMCGAGATASAHVGTQW